MKDTVLGKIAWFFTARYRITILFWIILLLFGFLSYSSLLKREGFPDVTFPAATVQGTYFVDDAKKVDTEVVEPIANELKNIENIDSFQATSNGNFYTIFANFKEDISAETGTKEIKEAIASAGDIPGSEPQVTQIEPAKFDNKYNLLLAVYSKQDSSHEFLTKKAEGIAKELDSQKDIESAEAIPLTQESTDQSGTISKQQTNINKIAIREDGDIVFYPAITVGVSKTDNIDDIQLANLVEEQAQKIHEQDGYKDVNTRITADFASSIEEQINSLQSSMIGGLIAVLIVALLLISWRAALVVALFVPTVLAATFIGIGLAGATINTITLFAVILTLGLFVDDATIIVEAIDARRRDKKGKKDIIKQAISRVGIASVAGTLTTAIVFAPMLLVTGIIGDFIKLLPITVMIALGVSLVLSILLVPLLSRIVILTGKQPSKWAEKIQIFVRAEKWIAKKLSKLPLLNRDRKGLGRLITTLLIGVSIIAIVGAGLFAGKLKFDVFPQSKDSNVIVANAEFDQSTTLENAKSITRQIDNKITRSVGDDLDYITYVNADQQGASIEIGLTHYNERDITSHEIIDKVESDAVDIQGATIKYGQQDAGPPSSDYPFQMRIYSSNEQDLENATNQISSFLKEQDKINIGQTEVKVSEVKTNLDSESRTDRGVFKEVFAKFDNPDHNSSAIVELEEIVKSEFDETKLSSLNLTPESLDFDVSQESEDVDSFSSMGIGLLVAIILMYVLLVILFNSFSQPLLIFMAIPFSLFGVFFGLYATDNALSFFVMLALMGLIGISVNNTILLTQYANQERANGADRFDAISRAVKDRFRPLVTTTLTTMFALLPLALNDPFWQPLALTLIFGMLSSTLLIIISFPYYYLGLERVRNWKNRKFPSLK